MYHRISLSTLILSLPVITLVLMNGVTAATAEPTSAKSATAPATSDERPAAGTAGQKIAAAEAPIDITISEILKDPWRFNGKLVRVRGTFDECISYSCNLCEALPPPTQEKDRFAACMGVSFDSESTKLEPAGTEEQRSLMWRKAWEMAERNVRFATVTLEARYDATCSGVDNPDPQSDYIIACSDRATQLAEARTVRVHIRRPATAGTITQYRGHPVVPAHGDEAKAMGAAFRAVSSMLRRNGKTAAAYLYVWKTPLPLWAQEWAKEENIDAFGGACICLLKDCGGITWPRRNGDAFFDVPANPYKCWEAEKRKGVWRFFLE